MASSILGVMKLHSDKLAQVYYLRCTNEYCVVSYYDKCDPRIESAKDDLSYSAFKKEHNCTNQMRTEIFKKSDGWPYQYYSQYLDSFK